MKLPPPDTRLAALTQFTVPQFGVLTAGQTERCGYTPREVEKLCASATWTRMRNGIYLPCRLPEDPRLAHLAEVAAALLSLGADDAVVSHVSAAILWKLDWILAPDASVVTLTRPASAKSRLYPGLRVRPAPLPAHHVARGANGMPTTTVARTIVDLARVLARPDVLVMGDAALNGNLVTRSQIDGALADCAGFPHVRRAYRHLAQLDGRSESAAESLCRAILLELGIESPELQVEIFDARGRPVGRVDFFFRSRNVAIETDGRDKYKTPQDLWDEKRREDAVREQGVEFLRLSWGDLIGDRAELVVRIRATFARAARRLAS